MNVRSRATLVVAIALTSAVALLGACTTSTQRGAEDEQRLTYLEPIFFNTLYPPSAGTYPNGAVLNNIADRLLYQDPVTLELTPWIATALPEVNEDATEYTFDIRTDVTYSDGTPLTAENVVANFDLYGRGDTDRVLTTSEQITNYERGEVVDSDTVRFHFSAPAPGFAQATSSFNASLLADASLALANDGFAPGNATGIIGSGPFVIDSEQLGTRLELSAREDYDWAPPAHPHQGRARLDGIDIVLASEDSVRVGGLVAGQADIARQMEAPVEKHLQDAGINVVWHGTNGVNNGLSFRFMHPHLQDIRTRQALIHAINREEIMHTLFSDSYVPATSALAHTALGYEEQNDAYIYDPERAVALLEEVGWTPGADGIRTKDGERLEFTINEAVPQPRSREIVTKIQEQLRRVGVEIHLNPGDNATQNADSKDFHKIAIRHTMVGRADYDVIKSMWHSKNRNELLNGAADGTVHDQQLDDMLHNIASLAKEEDRAEQTREVQRYLTENAYILPLFEEPQVYGVQPYVHGFQPESIGRPSFYGVWIDRENPVTETEEQQ